MLLGQIYQEKGWFQEAHNNFLQAASLDKNNGQRTKHLIESLNSKIEKEQQGKQIEIW